MSKRIRFLVVLAVIMMISVYGSLSIYAAVTNPHYDAIYTGSPWYDEQGNIINAHGACIIKDNGKYYLFGECHSDTSNAFTAFNCYSSTDLNNWRFENQVLKVQASGILGPSRVGERVKVMKCPSTGEYVMFMHCDNLTYTDQSIGYATCATVNGNYSFKGQLLYSGSAIKKWDMGAFQDTDGTGYILIHGGYIYKLASDYHSAISMASGGSSGESPAMFKSGSTYYWLSSNKTSWERNDNFYSTATSPMGSWTSRGTFAPRGKLTWNSQTTFVLPVTGSNVTTYIFMGDRWSYPRQGSAATYVWQPLTVNGTTLSIPTFYEAWQINQTTGIWSAVSLTGTSVDDNVYGTGTNQFNYTGSWIHTTGGGYNNTESRSATAGAAVFIKFTGTRIKLYGVAGGDGGYGAVTIIDSNNSTVVSATIDFYSKYRDTANELKYVSPLLTSGTYTLKLTVVGAHSTWSDKAGTVYGSIGDYVSVDRVVISGSSTSTPTPTSTLTPTPTTTPSGTTNLAFNKTASADSVQSSNPAVNGNDGSTTTRWCAADSSTGHWWEVDLGSGRNITSSEVMWEKSGQVYKYKVEVSTDNSNWSLKIDKTANTSTAQTQTDTFTATARYVRITITGLPSGYWASFFEFRVFGQ